MGDITAMAVVANIIGIFAIERLMGVFFDKRRTSFIVMVLSYVILLVPTVVFGHYIFGPIINPIVGIVAFLIVTFNYESSIVKKVVATVSIFLFTVAFAALVQILTAPIWSSLNDVGQFLLFSVMAGLVPFLVAVLLRRIKYIRSQAMPSATHWVYTLLITTFVAFFGAFFVYILISPGLSRVFMFLAFAFSLAIGLLIIYLYKTLSTSYASKLKAALYTQEKEYYFTQALLMQESVENMKSFRHDIKAHLATLIDYTQKDMSQEATAYLHNLQGSIEKTDVYSNTGNIAIDSIINYKLKDIESKNINLDLRVAVPPEIDVEVSDIVTILSNLLSNALDALEKVLHSKTLKVDIEQNQVGLYIKVENNYAGDINAISAGGGAYSYI